MSDTQSLLTYQAVTTSLKQFIAEELLYDHSGIALANDLLLLEEGIIDSIQIMQLLTFIQETFVITIAPDDFVLENFSSINAMATLILRHAEA